MGQAWYYNDADASDGREPHQYTPNRPVSLDQLAQVGVLHWTIDVTKPGYLETVDRISQERSYKNRDEITISKEALPNYDEKLKVFFTEHIHEDEEIRFILEGSGYFDIRSPGDRWIRIACDAGDMIILVRLDLWFSGMRSKHVDLVLQPAGMYHRFTLDAKNYLKAMRLFKEDPKWTPLNRSSETDVNPYRKDYLSSFAQPAAALFVGEL
ncbi:acireductone dioxygenase [Spizellomyces sp. 'palustris']|nr:acireductone dioxygenase [Spizellomyces sp. 'palustris']